MESIIDIDQRLFHFIHQDLANNFFDFIMPWIREKTTWIPLYLILLFILIKKFRRQVWLPLVCILLSVVLADQISSHLIKPWIQRIRPCNEPEIVNWIRNVVHCGSGYSFTSSHATNHFAIAVVVLFILRKWSKWVVPVALIWATSIAFAQVYVGVHYPLDVIGGAILGSLIGLFFFYLFRFLQTKIYNSN